MSFVHHDAFDPNKALVMPRGSAACSPGIINDLDLSFLKEGKKNKNFKIKFFAAALLMFLISVGAVLCGIFIPGHVVLKSLILTCFESVLGAFVGSTFSYALEFATLNKAGESKKRWWKRSWFLPLVASIGVLFVNGAGIFEDSATIDMFAYAGLSASLNGLGAVGLGTLLSKDKPPAPLAKGKKPTRSRELYDQTAKEWYKKLIGTSFKILGVLFGLGLVALLFFLNIQFSKSSGSYLIAGLVNVLVGTVCSTFLYPASQDILSVFRQKDSEKKASDQSAPAGEEEKASAPSDQVDKKAGKLLRFWNLIQKILGNTFYFLLSVILLIVVGMVDFSTKGQVHGQFVKLFNAIVGTFFGRLVYDYVRGFSLKDHPVFNFLACFFLLGAMVAGVALDILSGGRGGYAAFYATLFTAAVGGLVKDHTKVLSRYFFWKDVYQKEAEGEEKGLSRETIAKIKVIVFITVLVLLIILAAVVTHGAAGPLLCKALAAVFSATFGKFFAEWTAIAWRKNEIKAEIASLPETPSVNTSAQDIGEPDLVSITPQAGVLVSAAASPAAATPAPPQDETTGKPVSGSGESQQEAVVDLKRIKGDLVVNNDLPAEQLPNNWQFAEQAKNQESDNKKKFSKVLNQLTMTASHVTKELSVKNPEKAAANDDCSRPFQAMGLGLSELSDKDRVILGAIR